MAQTEADKKVITESEYISEDFHLYDCKLKSNVGINGNAHSMSLTSLFTNITIVEDLFSNVLKIQVTLVDAQGFMEAFPVIGDEVIELSFKNKKITKYVTTHRFRVYDLQIVPSDRQLSEYTLYGMSEDYMKSMQKRVCRRYSGLNSDSVKDIVRKNFGYSKGLKVEETKNTNSVIIPDWTPLEAINFLASRSMSAVKDDVESDAPEEYQTSSGSFFVFYEKLNEGWCFESIETMIAKQRDNDKIRYFYAPRALDGASQNNTAGMFGVERFQVISTFDTMRNLGRGMYASQLIAYDPIRMSYNVIKYDYFKERDSVATMRNKVHDFVTMDKTKNKDNKMVGVYSDLLGHHAAMTKLATTTTNHDAFFIPPPGSIEDIKFGKSTPIGASSESFNDRGATSNNIEDWLLQRNAQEQEFDNIRVKLSVAGNSSRHVGELIYFDFPSHIELHDVHKHRNQLYGGYYMISKIEHIITQTRYTMDMEIVKNSMLTDLPGNNEGYDPVTISVVQEGLDAMGAQTGKTGRKAVRNPDGSMRIVGGL